MKLVLQLWRRIGTLLVLPCFSLFWWTQDNWDLNFGHQVQNLVVKPSSRRKGVASQIICWCATQSRRRGATQLWMHVACLHQAYHLTKAFRWCSQQPCHIPLRRLWSKNGFSFTPAIYFHMSIVQSKVEADNEPALKFYQRLGFEVPLVARYWLHANSSKQVGEEETYRDRRAVRLTRELWSPLATFAKEELTNRMAHLLGSSSVKSGVLGLFEYHSARHFGSRCLVGELGPAQTKKLIFVARVCNVYLIEFPSLTSRTPLENKKSLLVDFASYMLGMHGKLKAFETLLRQNLFS